MESSLIILTVVFLLLPHALALKCYECTNIPGYPAAPCDQPEDQKVGAISCEPGLDKCMTIKGTFVVPGQWSLNIKMKNCSHSILCEPTSIFNSK
ncbi:hypothetical protein OS493_032132 [Desmophyllum pertusum]|uniref:Uncharacterized protein n=1 Tax=Desmophyllum pertusum TaxID=174260 RepID=A0A9W9YJE4_9CNID|nr:hypothetical protein OS493_032132 [Desmophyllum pertusum]